MEIETEQKPAVMNEAEEIDLLLNSDQIEAERQQKIMAQWKEYYGNLTRKSVSVRIAISLAEHHATAKHGESSRNLIYR